MHTPTAASPVRARFAAVWRRARRVLVALVLVLGVGPFVLVLPLNFVQPHTTMVILRRALQRTLEGRTPRFPRRVVVTRASISPHLRRAVLAAEDDRFYLHWGFDVTEIQSALERARRGRRLRGASTITQQVAKNLFLWEGRSYVRKAYEAYLTLVLEVCLPKDRILDLYLNLAEWGNGIFGAEMAARTHFGKSARALTPLEAAQLAAVLPSPLRWSPHGAVAARRAPQILVTMQYAAPRK